MIMDMSKRYCSRVGVGPDVILPFGTIAHCESEKEKILFWLYNDTASDDVRYDTMAVKIEIG